jgi:exopolysaccharide production protein ExoZ
MNNSFSKKIDSLQALRAFAAIIVMLLHVTNIIYNKSGNVFLNNFFLPGFSGVQIFFVLSGFIIFYTSSFRDLSVKQFLTKRFLRIYPIHTLIILSLVFFHFILPSPDQAYHGRIGVITSSLTLVMFDDMVLAPSWTLCYEITFYVIFAFTFLVNKRLFILAIVSWIALIFASQIVNLRTGLLFIDNLYNPINLNFIFGCFIAWIYIKYPVIKYSKWFLVPGVILFSTFWIFHMQGLLSDEELLRVIYVGIPSAILVFGLVYSTFKVPSLLVHLGDASFSLYLMHFPFISLLLKVFIKLRLNKYTSDFVMYVCIFICTIVLSWLFYWYIERNITKKISEYIRKRDKSNQENVQKVQSPSKDTIPHITI